MNYLEALKYGSKILKLNNIQNSDLDSELLLSEVLSLNRENILINLNKKLKKKNLINLRN